MSRLEKIKNYYSSMESLHPDIQEDMSWLINRVEELEKDKNEYIRWWKDEARLGNELRDENQRYREALEEILAEAYEEAGVHPDTGMQLETYIARIARKALEGEC